MKRFFRWLRCNIVDEHWNARSDANGWRPLFPITCDDCGELFYFTEADYPRKRGAP